MAHTYQYSADLFRADGTLVGRKILTLDWAPAHEWARFEWMRSALEGMNRGPEPDGRVEPIWHPKDGPPYVAGFRITFEGPGGEMIAVDFPTSYFRDAAVKASAPYVESGQFGRGDVFHFVPTAFLSDDARPASHTSDVVLETDSVVEPWPVTEGDLSRLMSSAREHEVQGPADVPVWIPGSLLDEAAALSSKAGDVETGGVLVGYLRRDRETRKVFVEVTAQLPARHTVAEMARLTFTARTWTDARGILQLRGWDEMMLGWWHSHVGRAVCKDCSPESQRACQFSRGFFSNHDRAFHRTAFSRAYQIGLVVNDSATGEISYSLFGWRQGQIQSRGFFTNGTVRVNAACTDFGESHSQIEGGSHESNAETA